MRYVGLTVLGILFWADVILLRMVLTHHCTPEDLAREAPPVSREVVYMEPWGAHPEIPIRARLYGHEGLVYDSWDRPADNPLTKAALVAGLNAVRPRIHDCYVEHGAPGTAMVNIIIGKGGAVTGATVTGKFAGTPTGACVERAVATARFPRSDGFVTPYPFQLK